MLFRSWRSGKDDGEFFYQLLEAHAEKNGLKGIQLLDWMNSKRIQYNACASGNEDDLRSILSHNSCNGLRLVLLSAFLSSTGRIPDMLSLPYDLSVSKAVLMMVAFYHDPSLSRPREERLRHIQSKDAKDQVVQHPCSMRYINNLYRGNAPFVLDAIGAIKQTYPEEMPQKVMAALRYASLGVRADAEVLSCVEDVKHAMLMGDLCDNPEAHAAFERPNGEPNKDSPSMYDIPKPTPEQVNRMIKIHKLPLRSILTLVDTLDEDGKVYLTSAFDVQLNSEVTTDDTLKQQIIRYYLRAFSINKQLQHEKPLCTLEGVPQKYLEDGQLRRDAVDAFPENIKFLLEKENNRLSIFSCTGSRKRDDGGSYKWESDDEDSDDEDMGVQDVDDEGRELALHALSLDLSLLRFMPSCLLKDCGFIVEAVEQFLRISSPPLR